MECPKGFERGSLHDEESTWSSCFDKGGGFLKETRVCLNLDIDT